MVLWISRHVNRDAQPRRRVVIQFEFSGAKLRWLWLVLEPTEASVCLKYPGFDIDLRVTADPTALYDVYLGRTSLTNAKRARNLRIEGPTDLVHDFANWFTWSKFAPVVRTTLRQQRRLAETKTSGPAKPN